MKRTLLIAMLIILGSLVSCTAITTSPLGETMEMSDFIQDYTYLNTKNLLPNSGKVGISGIGDPHVFYDETEDKYFMTGTHTGLTFSLWESTDLTTWSTGTQIFDSSKVAWGEFGGGKGLWGAEIHKRGATYYLYYSSWKIGATSPRIGVATATDVYGPYTDKGEPLFDFGYSAIDNHLFTDTDGVSYMYYVRDALDNVVEGVRESHIYAVEMNADFISTKDASEAHFLIRPDQIWERISGGTDWKWVEGCWMHKQGDKYYLFYSANRYDEVHYAIGYAVSDSPFGPFVKSENNPVLKTVAAELSGPGNNSFFYSKDGRELLTAYHMHTNPANPSGNRYVNIDRVGFRADGSVYINGPTVTFQPIPSGTKAFHTLLTDDATVETSGVLAGYNANGAIDGELVMTDQYEANQFIASGAINQAFVKIVFPESRTVNSIFIYIPITVRFRSTKINIEFSDGTKINDISTSMMRGEAIIINTNGIATEWIKITSAQSGFGQTNFGLNEVYAFGSR
jgi:GH43 family beta-xylosidase